MQAEGWFAGRRAADARLLVPDTPPAVFAVAADDHPVIPNTGTRNAEIPGAGILDTVSLVRGALSVHAGTGRVRAVRPVQPSVDDANSKHLYVSHP